MSQPRGLRPSERSEPLPRAFLIDAFALRTAAPDCS